MARIFEFNGKPEDYRWDFPLKNGREYAGHLLAHSDMTIEEILDMPEDKNFPENLSKEWKEVKNEH